MDEWDEILTALSRSAVSEEDFADNIHLAAWIGKTRTALAEHDEVIAGLVGALRAISNAKDVPLVFLQHEVGDAISAHYQRIADAALADPRLAAVMEE